MSNRLFFGDNLDVLREHIVDESVDLVYLDPPFNSKAQYNVIFKSTPDDQATAQAEAFRDSWTWTDEAEWSFKEVMRFGGGPARILDALRGGLGENDLLAYLAMMTPRLIELHRTLKDTGSLFLHCDPTASHYLKIITDSIFSPENFRNEIVWRRTGSHNSTKRFGPIHDTILFYSKSKNYFWRRQTRPYMVGHVEKAFKKEGNRYRTNYSGNVLTGSGRRNGISGKTWRGFDPDKKGRHWAVPSKLLEGLPDDISHLKQNEKMDYLFDKGHITIKEGDEWPRYQRHITKQDGQYLSDIWAYQPYTEGTVFDVDEGIDDDVRWMGSKDSERIGYPTQKPLGLLNRIIESASDEGFIVLDPFCGCGTSVASAERLKRQWIGIDVAFHAIKVIEARLKERFAVTPEYKLEGIPRDFKSAAKLAEKDKYQFQWWANYLFDPHALREQKKGADRGIDGECFFANGPGRPYGRMLTSVKGGNNVGPAMVRDFRGTLEREKAQMGLFICLKRPTKAMMTEASAGGLADTVHGDIPKLQIVAIEDWFEGKLPKLPPLDHLPSAALSSIKRRVASKKKAKRPDPKAPEFMFEFSDKDEENVVRHINPAAVISRKAG